MYFKIFNEGTYHNGLNVYSKSLNSIFEWRDGLFFADEKNILDFYYSGDKIATMSIKKEWDGSLFFIEIIRGLIKMA